MLSAFIPAASHARKRCCSCCLRYIFSYSCAPSSNYSAARQTFRFFPAFAIGRGRCRSVRGNAPHSFQRLLMLVSDAPPVVRAAYFVQLYTRAFKMICGTANVPLFSAFAIDCVKCRFCAQNTLHSLRQLLTRPQAMLFLLSALHIFVHLCVVF